MTERENYLMAIHHQKPQWVPVYGAPARFACGFMDEFEKGPAGGGKDGFGVLWIPSESADGAVVPDSSSFILEDISEWKDIVKFPDLDTIDWEKKAETALAGLNRTEQVLEYGVGNGHFERLAALMGFENTLCALYEEPESCMEFFEALTAYKIKLIDKIAAYFHPDMICHYDDVATERNLFMSPAIYRKVIKPYHKKFNDAVKKHGIIPIIHCCGYAETIAEDFIEEGAEAWTSVQPYNDINKLLEKYGGSLCLIGGYDGNGEPGRPDATEETRREYVRKAIDTYGKNGSFILGNLTIMTGKGAAYKQECLRQILDEANRYGKSFQKS